VDEARAAFSASESFLELSAFEVFQTSGFALFAVAAVELQRHKNYPRN
jgi:hypothetical protein